MSIRTTMVGSYPKVTDSGADNLPGVIDRWQRKLVDDAGLEKEVQKVIHRVIGEQEQAGLDLVTDGQIRWEDLPHALVRGVLGTKRGTLRRFFDNNVYYRRVELNGHLQWQKSFVADEFQFAAKSSKKPVKAVLPGPLTLVISTEPTPDQSREWLLSSYTDLLRKEVEALVKAGVRDLQIDEPALQPNDPLVSKTVEAINQIFKGVTARKWVALYFHDVSSILPQLAKLQADVLSLDLIAGPQLLKQLRGGIWPKEIALGLIDGRNTKLESVEEIKRQIGQLSDAVPLDSLWLTSNSGLEFLPHESALKKLQLMHQVAAAL